MTEVQRADQERSRDFVMDGLATGRAIRALTVVDSYTRGGKRDRRRALKHPDLEGGSPTTGRTPRSGIKVLDRGGPLC